MDEAAGAGRVVYTVGHSNHALDTFLGLLARHRIEVLVDTRSRPHSKYVPHFNHDVLQPAILAAGLRFVFLGSELGGRPEGAEFYDAQGHVLYDRVAQTPAFQTGIDKLEKGAERYRVAMLCSEENPADCHRRLLIGRVLGERGAQIIHIRGDGRLQSETELSAEEAGENAGQPSLFAEFEEEDDRAWRSTLSVLPKRPPGSSSRR